jgi:hypothetical protein
VDLWSLWRRAPVGRTVEKSVEKAWRSALGRTVEKAVEKTVENP